MRTIIESEKQAIIVIIMKEGLNKRKHRTCLDDTSGQISLDYISGIVIFILAFYFIFQLLTNIFIPFLSSSDDIQSIADRVSVSLVESIEGLSSSSDSSNTISMVDVNNFRSDMENNYNSTIDIYGLTTSTRQYYMNVSLYDTQGNLYEYDNQTSLNTGPVPPPNTNIALSKRLVYIEQTGDIAILTVKVW